MRASFRIEPMKEADVVEVAAIGSGTRLEETQLRDELARTWSRKWVVREGSFGVVAYLVAWHVVDELHVLNLATRADRRRRGIGRALLQAAIEYGRAHRLRHVVLEVRRSNEAAIALYRTSGFSTVGVRRRYYPDDEDALEMMLLLDPEADALAAHPKDVGLH